VTGGAGLNRRLAHPGGGAQLGDLPILGGVALVLAIAEGRACALASRAAHPAGASRNGTRAIPIPMRSSRRVPTTKAASSDSRSFKGLRPA